MKHIRLLTLATVFLAPLAMNAPAAAQAADLRGQYKLDPVASDSIEKVIERTVASMNFIKRPIARSRLTKTAKTLPNLVLSQDEREIVVTFDSRHPIRMPRSGDVAAWTRDDGETFQVQGTWKDTELRQTFKAPDGERTHVFRLDPAGDRLTLQVTLSSPQLPEPMRYTLVYRRDWPAQ